ncbi:MAG: hypothetical protein ACRD50_15985 [Candidatus Acidiferrales bacterium]
MKISSRLHLKTGILICLMVVFGPLGDVFLRKGMQRIGAVTTWTPASLGRLFFETFTSGSIWLGISLLLMFFICYMLVLSWADYSFVQPASASSYAFVAFLGAFVLGEVVRPERWLGVGIICLGVFMVGRTPPRTTEPS